MKKAFNYDAIKTAFLWLDDKRPAIELHFEPKPPYEFDAWLAADSYSSCIERIMMFQRKGIKFHISFDHDLGEKKTGYDVAKYIVKNQIPCTFSIHSMNPVGTENIRELMTHYGYIEIKEYHEDKWQTRVKEHYKYVCEKYGEENILGVFLYGSQNYGLATEESDVDTKAILIPTLWDIAANKQPVSTELHMENGEHIEVKDIRLMCDMWKKQNMNFIEILFTKYKVLNPDYADIFGLFETIRNEIAFYNPNKTIASTAYQLLHTLEQGLREENVDNKKLANSMRLANFLINYKAMADYTLPRNYSVILKDRNYEDLKAIKMGTYYKSENEKKEQAEILKEHIESLLKEKNEYQIDEDVTFLMTQFVKKALLKRENL